MDDVFDCDVDVNTRPERLARSGRGRRAEQTH